jgi:death-on-curing protein
LVDGNKRLAWVAVVVFYGVNGLGLRAPQDPAHELIVGVAAGRLSGGGRPAGGLDGPLP